MKKLLLFTFFIVNIFALDIGKYFCVSTEVVRGDLKYKIPKNKMETVYFHINDNGELISKDEIWKYVITYKKVDIYKNPKGDLKMYVPSKTIEKNNYFKIAVIFKDDTSVYFECERIK